LTITFITGIVYLEDNDMAMVEDAKLIDTYFDYLGEWGNTKLASEHCAVSVATGRSLEAKYPERFEDAMFRYREMLRGEVIKRIKDPEQYSERLLLKELEMVDHRYRTKVEVQHNHSVELVGRLQRAKERVLGNVVAEGVIPRTQEPLTLALEAAADRRAPMMASYTEEPDSDVIDAEFREI
jgi:hypothetical protein